MSYCQTIMQALSADEALSDMYIVAGGNADILPFPLPDAYVAVSDGQTEGDFLPGTDTPVMQPAVVINVFTPESEGAPFCRECAEAVCCAVTESDSGRMITSVSVSPCKYCDEYMAWEYDIVFGIREMD